MHWVTQLLLILGLLIIAGELETIGKGLIELNKFFKEEREKRDAAPEFRYPSSRM